MSPSSPVRSTHHDVVVVGGRVAGAATALHLARAGHDVAVLDRSRLPSDCLSTHAIARPGVVQLSRWGLLDELLEGGCPPVRHVEFHARGEVTRRPVKEAAGVDLLVAPRRYLLDDLLARNAVAAGARLSTGVTVTGVLRDDAGRVRGVTVREARGEVHEVLARVVVGADGVGSRVAAYVGAPVLERHAPSGAVTYAYVGGEWDAFEFHVSDQAFAGVFPTHHGEACVWLARPAALLEPVLTAGPRRLDAWVEELADTAPDLARRVRRGRPASPLRGAVGLPNHVRRAAGPGWALVGDAGYHRDPITGHGITDAFRDAELLAEAVGRGLRDPDAEAASLAGYEAARDAAITDVFALTREMGAFPPPDRLLDLQIQLSKVLEREATALAARPLPAGAVTTAA